MATGYQPISKTGRDQPPIGGSALAPPPPGPVRLHVHVLQHFGGSQSVRIGPKSRVVGAWGDAKSGAIVLLIESPEPDAEHAEAE